MERTTESDEPPDERTPEGSKEESSKREAGKLTSMPLNSSVLHLAGPAVARKACQSLIEMVSLIIVGSLGAEAIASVGIGKRIIMMSTAIMQALSVGATAIVARYYGAGDEEGARRVVTQTVLLGLGLGACVAVAGVTLAPYIMRGMMALQEAPDAGVIAHGTAYLRSLSAFYVLAIPLFMSIAIFQGAGDMKTPLYLMIYMNAVNVVLAYVLVNGIGFFPAMGVTGAGLAAGFARGSAGLIALTILARDRGVIGMDVGRLVRFDTGLVRSIVAVGLPAAGEKFVQRGSQILYTMLIAGMGTTAIAANAIAMSIQSLSFIPGFGFSMATTALVGQNLGAQKPGRAEKCGYAAYRYAVMLVGAGIFFFLFAPRFIAGFYTNDADVVSLTAMCLRIIAISMPFMAMIQVFSGGLRGAGDTRVVMFINTLGNWGVRLLGSYLLGWYMGLGLVGVWIAMALDQFARGMFLLWRFRAGHWKWIQVGPDAPGGGEHARDDEAGDVAAAVPQKRRAAGP